MQDTTTPQERQENLTVADLEEMYERGELSGKRFSAAQISNETYHTGPGISSTQIAEFMQSPRRYHWRYIDRSEGKRTTASMEIGSAVHKLVLEPDQFDTEYAVFDGARTAKKAYAAFCEQFEGRIILTTSEFENIQRCADAVKKDAFAMRFLSGGVSEESLYATDKVTGQLVRCRIDHQPPAENGVNFIVDLKTIRELNDIEKQLWDYRRDVSAALYTDIYKAITKEPATFVHVYVSTSEPSEVAVFQLGDFRISNEEMGLLTHGRLAYKHALVRIKWCAENNIWPSSRGWDWVENKPTIEKGDLPYWAYKKEEV
jgi:exodeoxyribonuclease VIII